MNLVLRVRRIPRLPFTQRPCVERAPPAHSQEEEGDEEQIVNEPEISPVGDGFRMHDLPIEILGEVIDHLLLPYLPHPRKAWWDLPCVLSLYTVNRTWAKEVLRALRLHITLPNLPLPWLRRPIPPGTLLHQQRRDLLASALYNSSLSLKYRHVGCSRTKALQRAVKLAEHIEGPSNFPPFRRNEVTRMLCTAIAQNGQYWKISTPPQTLAYECNRETAFGMYDLVIDALCIAVIIGAEQWYLERAKRLTNVRTSYVFGHPMVLAKQWGRMEVLEWLKGLKGLSRESLGVEGRGIQLARCGHRDSPIRVYRVPPCFRSPTSARPPVQVKTPFVGL